MANFRKNSLDQCGECGKPRKRHENRGDHAFRLGLSFSNMFRPEKIAATHFYANGLQNNRFRLASQGPESKGGENE